MKVVCFGILVADVFLPPQARMPPAGALVTTGDFVVEPGGCAANTAVNLVRLGLAASVVGRVGDDVFGRFIETDLARRGVSVAGVARSGAPTSKTVIVDIEGEDRRYFHTVGANAALTAADLERAELAAGDVLYVGGYLVMPGVGQLPLARFLEEARAGGARTVLDVVVPGGAHVDFDQVERLLPFVDTFLPNEDEARALTGEASPHRQARRFVEAGAGMAVVTRGAQGAVLAAPGCSLELPAPAVGAVVDSSGAGDAFAAGFICGMTAGWATEHTFAFASAVGASACTALGCSAGVFSREAAEDFVQRHHVVPAGVAGL